MGAAFRCPIGILLTLHIAFSGFCFRYDLSIIYGSKWDRRSSVHMAHSPSSPSQHTSTSNRSFVWEHQHALVHSPILDRRSQPSTCSSNRSSLGSVGICVWWLLAIACEFNPVLLACVKSGHDQQHPHTYLPNAPLKPHARAFTHLLLDTRPQPHTHTHTNHLASCTWHHTYSRSCTHAYARVHVYCTQTHAPQRTSTRANINLHSIAHACVPAHPHAISLARALEQHTSEKNTLKNIYRGKPTENV